MKSLDISRKDRQNQLPLIDHHREIEPQPEPEPERVYPYGVDFFVPENAPYDQVQKQLTFTFPKSRRFDFSFKKLLSLRIKFRLPKFGGQFKKSFVLVPFTVIVLLIGSVIGTRFINFASSVSLSNTSAYQNFTQSLGAILGNNIPALKNLDSSTLAQLIREKRQANVLLLGYGGDSHQGGYLTDTIMLMHLDFATNKVALISIPRDTWIKIPTASGGGSFTKINAAYAIGMDDQGYPHKLPTFTGPSGGGNLARFEVSKILGMPINYFVAVDFSGFENIVNTLGGVEINVENSFTDYSYPVSDENINGAWCVAPDNTQTLCRYKQVHFDVGQQFMDGARALEYSRSRHAAGIEGSDFARARRQQKLIVAIEQKALSLNAVPKVLELMADIQGHFQTDMSLAEVKDLAGYLSKINLDSATRLSIDDHNLLVQGTSADGQYILTPAAGDENFNDIQTYIFNSINGNAQTTKTNTNTQGKKLN